MKKPSLNPQRYRQVLVFLASGLLLLFLFHEANGGELHVGQKIVYPGGADQPPKEKDVGVKFKAEPISASVETRDTSGEETDFEQLLADGKTEMILRETAGKSDPIHQAYRALALFQKGRKKEALPLSEKVLKSDDLPDEVRAKIEDLLRECASSTVVPK